MQHDPRHKRMGLPADLPRGLALTVASTPGCTEFLPIPPWWRTALVLARRRQHKACCFPPGDPWHGGRSCSGRMNERASLQVAIPLCSLVCSVYVGGCGGGVTCAGSALLPLLLARPRSAVPTLAGAPRAEVEATIPPPPLLPV